MADHWKANKSGGLPPSYYNSSFNQYSGGQRHSPNSRYPDWRPWHKAVLQSAISVAIFGMVWGLFSWGGPNAVALQSSVRGWFTEGADLTPVFQVIDGITTYGDSFDKAGYEVVSAQPQQYSADEAMTVPVSGTVIQSFGMTSDRIAGKNAEGIIIESNEPAVVKAAYDGTVTGVQQGEVIYIMLSHDNGLVTTYGGCTEVYVKADQQIKKGQAIARVGEDNSQGRLYFEAKYLGKAINPLSLLTEGSI